jgi:hypothetical protein
MTLIAGELKKDPSKLMTLIEAEVKKSPAALMAIIQREVDTPAGQAALAKYFLTHVEGPGRANFIDLLIGFIDSRDAETRMKNIVARYAFEALPKRDESKALTDEGLKKLAAAMDLSYRERKQSERLMQGTDIAQKEAEDPAIYIREAEGGFVKLGEYLRKKE